MQQTLSALIVLGMAVSFSMTGCGEDPAPVDAMNIDEFLAAAAQKECEFIFSCCDAMERSQYSMTQGYALPPSQAECNTQMAKLFQEVSAADTKNAIADGRVGFDGAKAALCSANTRVTCTENGHLDKPPECAAVYFGRVADGDICAGGFDCAATNSICVVPAGATTGTCKPRTKLGESCDEVQCESGLVCAIENMKGTCIRLTANGEACATRYECDSYYCDPATNRCAPLRVEGQTCASQDDCHLTFCEAMTMVCTAHKTGGTPCVEDFECASFKCDTATKTCTPPPAPFCDGN